MDFTARLQTGAPLLMEGALGERLKREFGLPIDGVVAMASLVYDARGRAALAQLWGQYAAVARAHHLSLLVTTPTRRANRARVRSPRGTRPSSATTCASCAVYSGKTARICTWVG